MTEERVVGLDTLFDLTGIQRGERDYNQILSRIERRTERTADNLNRAFGSNPFENLGRGIGRSIDTMDRDLRRGERSLNRFDIALGTLGGNVLTSAVAAIGTAIDRTIELGAAAIEVSDSFETAFVGVAKTVDGLGDVNAQGVFEATEQGEALRDTFERLSTEIPTTFEEINRIAELGGQLGLVVGLDADEANDTLEAFARTIGGLDEATDLTTEQAALSLARFTNIFGDSVDDAGLNIEALGNVIVRLGNETATTESQIVTLATRLAGAGQVAGFTQADLFGIAAASSSVGLQAEAAGTAISRSFNSINDVVNNTGQAFVNNTAAISETEADIVSLTGKLRGLEQNIGVTGDELLAQRDAFIANGGAAEDFGEQLGDTGRRRLFEAASDLRDLRGELDELRATNGQPIQSTALDTLARVAGITSEEFQELWRDDAGQAFSQFIAGLEDEGANIDDVLSEIGINGAIATRVFQSLAGAGDDLGLAVATANAEFANGNALLVETSRRYATAESRAQIFENRIRVAGAVVGDIIGPLRFLAIDALSPLVDTFGQRLPDTFDLFVDRLGPVFSELLGGFEDVNDEGNILERTFDAIDSALENIDPDALVSGIRDIRQSFSDARDSVQEVIDTVDRLVDLASNLSIELPEIGIEFALPELPSLPELPDLDDIELGFADITLPASLSGLVDTIEDFESPISITFSPITLPITLDDLIGAISELESPISVTFDPITLPTTLDDLVSTIENFESPVSITFNMITLPTTLDDLVSAITDIESPVSITFNPIVLPTTLDGLISAISDVESPISITFSPIMLPTSLDDLAALVDRIDAPLSVTFSAVSIPGAVSDLVSLISELESPIAITFADITLPSLPAPEPIELAFANVTAPDLPDIQLDPLQLEFETGDIPEIELPTIDRLRLEFDTIEFPDLPEFDLPDIEVPDNVTGAFDDLASSVAELVDLSQADFSGLQFGNVALDLDGVVDSAGRALSVLLEIGLVRLDGLIEIIDGVKLALFAATGDEATFDEARARFESGLRKVFIEPFQILADEAGIDIASLLPDTTVLDEALADINDTAGFSESFQNLGDGVQGFIDAFDGIGDISTETLNEITDAGPGIGLLAGHLTDLVAIGLSVTIDELGNLLPILGQFGALTLQNGIDQIGNLAGVLGGLGTAIEGLRTGDDEQAAQGVADFVSAIADINLTPIETLTGLDLSGVRDNIAAFANVSTEGFLTFVDTIEPTISSLQDAGAAVGELGTAIANLILPDTSEFDLGGLQVLFDFATGESIAALESFGPTLNAIATNIGSLVNIGAASEIASFTAFVDTLTAGITQLDDIEIVDIGALITGSLTTEGISRTVATQLSNLFGDLEFSDDAFAGIGGRIVSGISGQLGSIDGAVLLEPITEAFNNFELPPLMLPEIDVSAALSAIPAPIRSLLGIDDGTQESEVLITPLLDNQQNLVEFTEGGAETGAAYGEGVQQGLEENQEGILTAVSNFASDWITAGKQAIGAESPATSGIELGADYVAGVALGIEQSLDLLIGPLEAIAITLAESLSGLISGQVPIIIQEFQELGPAFENAESGLTTFNSTLQSTAVLISGLQAGGQTGASLFSVDNEALADAVDQVEILDQRFGLLEAQINSLITRTRALTSFIDSRLVSSLNRVVDIINNDAISAVRSFEDSLDDLSGDALPDLDDALDDSGETLEDFIGLTVEASEEVAVLDETSLIFNETITEMATILEEGVNFQLEETVSLADDLQIELTFLAVDVDILTEAFMNLEAAINGVNDTGGVDIPIPDGGGPGLPPNPGPGPFRTGTSGRFLFVPPGFYNDDYPIRLTSGEAFLVLNPQEVAALQSLESRGLQTPLSTDVLSLPMNRVDMTDVPMPPGLFDTIPQLAEGAPTVPAILDVSAGDGPNLLRDVAEPPGLFDAVSSQSPVDLPRVSATLSGTIPETQAADFPTIVSGGGLGDLGNLVNNISNNTESSLDRSSHVTNHDNRSLSLAVSVTQDTLGGLLNLIQLRGFRI